ncbi:MAG: Spy/CpxP family protein refolding chaperone [Paludisphaera borealis]|uniref:Spy/CpxP family protein refolding chaperone n=1 Tax=Paludisphaera borealis TaxID=1387353 RepID=UPI002850D994|nr:Spy/CpxP family protein refolding chaperone [Paludisphaera borealis]MDR3623026.1 Spy/CpxP family protein refolding chaperone [Paludisphaera borealis]
MTPLVRRSIAALASTAFMTFALASALPLNAAQDAGTTKTKAQTAKKKIAKKAETTSKSDEAAAPAAEEDDEAEAKPKAKGGRQAPPDAEHRVPAYFGALNLTDAQKESIYKIQGKYHPQIQEIEKKAEVLRERQKSEIEDVLTAPQKKALTEARKAASDRRKAAAKARDGI